MSKSVLITRPHYDPVTKYLCEWSEEVLALSRSKTVPVYDLKGNKAARDKVESYIKAHQPSLIFLNGHGNSQVITGHDNESIVDARSIIRSIIYARSCDGGRDLGPNLVKQGTKAFIGYVRKFIFAYLPEKMTHPRHDNLAALFLQPSNLVPTTLLKDKTSGEAHRRSREAMYRNFRKMISSTATYEERQAARFLWANINSQVLLGDTEATM